MTASGISGGGHVTARCTPTLLMSIRRGRDGWRTVYQRCDRHGQALVRVGGVLQPRAVPLDADVTRTSVLRWLGLQRGDVCAVVLREPGTGEAEPPPQYGCEWKLPARFIDLHRVDLERAWVLVKPPHNWPGWNDHNWPLPDNLLIDPVEARTANEHVPVYSGQFLALVRTADVCEPTPGAPAPPPLPDWCWAWDVKR